MLFLSISKAFDAIWHSQGERALMPKLGLLVRFDARTAAAGRKCLAFELFLHHRAGHWCRTEYRPARGFIEFHTFILPVLRVCSSLHGNAELARPDSRYVGRRPNGGAPLLNSEKALWLLRYGLPDLRDYIRSTCSFSDLYGLDVCILAGCPSGCRTDSGDARMTHGRTRCTCNEVREGKPNTTFQCSALDLVCT